MLIGGVVGMPGALELARVVFQNSVRISIPDYIGVREAQYTTGVGIVKYALQNLRRHQKESSGMSAPSKVKKKPRVESQSAQLAEPKDSKMDKLKSWFKEFI